MTGGDVNDVMPGSDGLGFLVILNKSSELRFGLGRSELIFGPGWGRSSYELRGAHARCLSQWVESWRWTNSQHRKIQSLSPRVENRNLKKVIKVSYLNQKRVVSVSCFSDSCAYEHSMNILCIWIFWPYATQLFIYSCDKPVGWGCKIHQLNLCRGVRHPPNKCHAYDIKQSDNEAPVMQELWGIQSTLSLPLLPGPFRPRSGSIC